MTTWNTVRLACFLTLYRIECRIDSAVQYRQVTISKSGVVAPRGMKIGAEIGRKRQFVIDLKQYPHTVLFTRQGLRDGSIGIAPASVDGCVVTENMPMMSVNTDVIDVVYLENLLSSDYFLSKIRKLPAVGSAQKSAHERHLLEVDILLPPRDVQNKIVKRLVAIRSQIDELHSEVIYQKSLLSQLRSQLLQGK